MIKSLLVLRIAGQNPHLFHHDVKEAVNAILDRIVSAMARRDRVELRDFGTFVVKVRKTRVGRNPKTGAQVHVPAKVTPATRLCERPEGRRLLDILREGDTLVVRWVDRLGRNYQDVTDTVREFIRRGIRIETVINRMVFDGTTADPMQQAIRDSLIAFMAATAQSQSEVTKEAQKPGSRTRWQTTTGRNIAEESQHSRVTSFFECVNC